MSYQLGNRSLAVLRTVKPQLQHLAQRAIALTEQDFTVYYGIRTLEEQRKLVASGKSKTMNSRHLTGDAIDIGAWVNGGIDWNDENKYYAIADAIFEAARELGIAIRWGGAWHITDAPADGRAAKELCEEYVSIRRSEGRSAFIDLVHFELPRAIYG